MEAAYQRSEMRASVYGGGSLTWEDADEGSRTSPVVVRNLSGHGLQVVCQRAVRAGAAVFLTGETYECLGEVKYCVHVDGGFRIGIELRREPYLRTSDAALV
jgi:hypothetical protein